MHNLLAARDEEIGRLRERLRAQEARRRDDLERADERRKALEVEFTELQAHLTDELSQVHASHHDCKEQLLAVTRHRDHEAGDLRVKLRDQEAGLQQRADDIRVLREQVQRQDAEIQDLKAVAKSSREEVERLRADLKRQSAKAWHQPSHAEGDAAGGTLSSSDSRAPPRSAAADEVERLKAEVHDKTFQLQRMELHHEKILVDHTDFLQRLALSSSGPTILSEAFDLQSAEALGKGNFGYILACNQVRNGERVVIKLQSTRWVSVAVQEWGHGSALAHPNMVAYHDAFVHRDSSRRIARLLEDAFTSGTLSGKRPKEFPGVYFVLALEYMDRGTVQHLMDRRMLTTQCVAAVTRQVASALAFVHSHKRTHNDIKPENILLRSHPDGQRIVVKLADLGLADHSVDRKRDCDLFGYSVYCMGLTCKFEKIPDGEHQASAIAALKKHLGTQEPRWRVLADVVTGLWQGRLSMADVESQQELQDAEVYVQSEENKLEAKAAAHRSIAKRCKNMHNLRSEVGKVLDLHVLLKHRSEHSQRPHAGLNEHEEDLDSSSDEECRHLHHGKKSLKPH